MKRCPECGFRAKDDICPLCGVRMRSIQTADKRLDTHVHDRTGEDCFLPGEKKNPPKKKPEFVKSSAAREIGQSRSRRNQMTPASVVVVLILLALLRACAR